MSKAIQLQPRNKVVGFLISDNKKWVGLDKNGKCFEAQAMPDEKSPRATMSRAVKPITVGESAWTMFAEYLDPFENLRVVYFFAAVKCEPTKGIWWENSDLSHWVIRPKRDLLWLVPMALHWEHANLENIIMLKRKPLA